MMPSVECKLERRRKARKIFAQRKIYFSRGEGASLAGEFTREEVDRERPGELGGVRMIPRRAGIDEAMAAERKEMPFETLSITREGVPHLALDGNGRHDIVRAV